MKEEFFKKVKEVVEQWYLDNSNPEDSMNEIRILIDSEDETGE